MSNNNDNSNLDQLECSDFITLKILEQENEIELLREQIEMWRELTQSLTLELRYKDQQLQELERELQYTNQELYHALMEESIKFDNAKDKTILPSKKPAIKALNELVSTNSATTGKPGELEHVNKSSSRKIPLETTTVNSFLNEYNVLKSEFNAFKVKYNELEAKFIEFKASFRRRKMLREKLKAELKVTRNNCSYL